METWYVYILECQGKYYYTGITNDVEARLKKHREGKGAKFTRGRNPIELKAVWEFPSKSEAAKREAQIKKLTKKQKKDLIDGF